MNEFNGDLIYSWVKEQNSCNIYPSLEEIQSHFSGIGKNSVRSSVSGMVKSYNGGHDSAVYKCNRGKHKKGEPRLYLNLRNDNGYEAF